VERLEMLHARRRRLEPTERLMLLVDELLGALDDTARLSAGLSADWHWQVQLGYMRDLQRVGHEMLASAAADEPRTHMTLRSRSRVPRRRERRCGCNGHGEGAA
jgi:hypothetical protein